MRVRVGYEVIQEFYTEVEIDETEFREWAGIGPNDSIINRDLRDFFTSGDDLPHEIIESGTPPVRTYESTNVMNALHIGEH